MKKADLYIRVSTDEQADKGYSRRYQEEMLRKYCDVNRISIRQVIFEDHSAKTFHRPKWKAYLSDLRKNKGKSDLVLFLKWDRFSRNAGDAYQMISTLRKLGVEPQAIDQPLDLSVPENKMMLAFYLAAPEVENDRRALNVIHGMRRARKEGRYMGLAPIGYINKTDETGRKYIAPDEPLATIIQWSFSEIARGVYNTEQVYKMAKRKGFTGVKSLFWFAVRNPVYCGKIFIPKYKEEESRFVKGLHDPLISEDLFYRVQDVLDGRKKRQFQLKVVANENLPLRGFLVCPKCGRVLTGSASKGNTKHYAYYHCYLGCNFRFRADNANSQFCSILKKYVPRQEMIELYKVVLQQTWKGQTTHLSNDKKQIEKQIEELKAKISYIRELLSSRQIEPEDYREMKSEYADKLDRLEARLKGAANNNETNFEQLLNAGLNNLLKLDYVYQKADMPRKQEIISSIFPEKLHFENETVRTFKVNEVVNAIYLIDNNLQVNKKGQNEKKSVLSSQVGMTGFEPATSSSRTTRATGLRYIPFRNRVGKNNKS
ncbi:recombinase family protein [Ravibacter arvi]|uniref:Recombinase family protein n=1 Tax=Ravibacter arvi TaxID=2051041 RepID=A0ABP8M9G0_9BACT